MAHIYRQLMKDHRNLECVLKVLEQEIGRYETETDDPETEPNIPLVLEIMDYLHYYPELFHHPLEEEAMALLERIGQGDPEQIARIRQEHVELEDASNDVRNLVNGISLGNPVSLVTLHQSLDKFLDQQRQHIRSEEATVFQDIKALPLADSDAIAGRVEHRDDPLYSEANSRQASQYNELIQRLASY